MTEQHPFPPEGMDTIARTLSGFYLALIAEGMPEQRAYDLTRDFFTAQAKMGQQEL